MKKGKLLWGAAFTQGPDKAMMDYTTSDVQRKKSAEEVLFPYDVAVNSAHSDMLAKKGILSKKENDAIQEGLAELALLFATGKFVLDSSKEDAPTNIETYLEGKYGELVGSMHAGKSRNDQLIATSRLYAKDFLAQFSSDLEKLISSLDKATAKYGKAKMPGFTHMQPAMPTTFGILLGSYSESLKRDKRLLESALDYLDESPMGAAAGYGTAFPVDRKAVAKSLGFSRVQENTIDATSSRGDHESVALFAVAHTMNHLANLSQTLIIFSMPQFGWVKLGDAYCTGSSMMPQKKNPDALEITKAKAVLAQSALQSCLALSRANFFGFNRDTQYVKTQMIDCFEECKLAPTVFCGIIDTLQVDAKKMANECAKYDLDATTKAEMLTLKKGVPYRQAKRMVESQLKGKKK